MSVANEHHAAPATLTHEFLQPPWVTGFARTRFLVIGGVLAVASAIAVVISAFIGGPMWVQHFFRSYLLGFVLCFGLSSGCLVLRLVQAVVSGRWNVISERFFEAGSRVMPYVGLAWIPLLWGARYMYPWYEGGTVHKLLDVKGALAVAHRATYLNFHAVLIRGIIFFVAWTFWAYVISNWSMRREEALDPVSARNLHVKFIRFGGGGIVFWAVTMTLFVVDWLMTLSPIWYSTIFGMIYMAGHAMIAMGTVLIVMMAFRKYEPLRSLLRVQEQHDMGNLMLAWVMLFAYLSFSQWLITWSANLPEEIGWYLVRIKGFWFPVIITLVFIHFAIPFVLLLQRSVKRIPTRLVATCALLIFARWGAELWTIEPQFADMSYGMHFGAVFGWFALDILIPAAMMCLWMALFFRELATRPLIALHHPTLHKILEAQHGH